MEKGSTLIYDGTFAGFLTCVFTVFEQKLKVINIHTSGEVQQDFFYQSEEVITDPVKATRVRKGILQYISRGGLRQVEFAFLSEQPDIEMLLLTYLKKAFTMPDFKATDYGDLTILKISQIAKMVSREKHRMEAFIRFKLTKDGIYFAPIEPDFNVLPIILPHFVSRYADQKWIIFDLKRKYGLYYNLHTTNYISFELSSAILRERENIELFDVSEVEFQKLWQQYFTSTNIKSRKNMRLHLQHVPKRYWKYLTEKSGTQN